MSTRSLSGRRGTDRLDATSLTLLAGLLTVCLCALVSLVGLLAIAALLGVITFIGLVVLFRRAPHVAAVLVVLGITVEPTVAFFVSASVGPAKDAVAIAGLTAVLLSLVTGPPDERRHFDAWLVGAVVLLIGLYIIDPAGSHGAAWADETRLVVEALGLFLVGYLGPQSRRTWKWTLAALAAAGLLNVLVGLTEQVLGPTRLILDFHFAFGTQVRETAGGQFRSFGTFADPFSYAELLILALAALGFHLRPRLSAAAVVGLLTIGVVSSFVRTELGLLVILPLLALVRARRISSAVAVGVAAVLVAVVLVGLPAAPSPAAPVHAGSFLLSVNGRGSAWAKILRPSVDLVAGRGVGTVGEGLSRSATGGLAAVAHYQPGAAVVTQQAGDLAYVDSTYLTTLAEVGLPGLLLLLFALARMANGSVRALRRGSNAGWSMLAMLIVVSLDALTRSSMLSYPFGYIALYVLGVGLATSEAESTSPATSGTQRIGAGLGWDRPAVGGSSDRHRLRWASRRLRVPARRRRPDSAGAAAYRPLHGLSAALLSRTGSRLFGLVFLVVIARHQSPQAFATYSYLLVLAAAASLVTDSGIALVAGREVARGQIAIATAYRGALPMQMLTGVLAGLGVAAVATVAPGPGATVSAAIVTGVFIFANAIFNLQCELLRGAARPWVEASLQTGAGVLQLGLGSWVVFSGRGLTALFIVLAAQQLVLVITAQCFLPWPRRSSDDQLHWRDLLRQGVWLGAASTCLALVMRLPQLLVSNVGSVTQAAHFAIASRYADLMATVCVTAGFGLLPAMTNRLSAGREGAAAFPRRILLTGGAIALILTPIMVALTPIVTTLVFGGRYRGAGEPAQIIVGSMPLMVALYLGWYGLIAHRRERRVLVSGVGALLTLPLGLVWIAERGSAVAAAEATVAAVLVAAVLAAASLLVLTRDERG